MPLLHIHLDSNTNEIDLGTDLPPQKLILRRVVVARDSTASETTDNSKYGAIIDLHEMFNGTEFISSLTGSNRLFVPNTPYDGASTHTHKQITTHDFNIRMGAEAIPRKFEVRVFDIDNVTLASFETSTQGHYDAIDMYWEYEGKN
tara:strand:- start:2866 stop:3303 length:438 start_codon:yes stop_codon:yes gene_type:complete